jgi:hypothetical protein
MTPAMAMKTSDIRTRLLLALLAASFGSLGVIIFTL